jgi:hypothetical protein
MRKLVFVVLMLLCATGAAAQTETLTPPPQFESSNAQVFLERDVEGTTLDRVEFIDPLSGESVSLNVNGTDYTVAGDAVMYVDTATGRVMLLRPNTEPREHSFIQPTPITRRIDWVVSADSKKIAWTITEGTAANQLTTTTRVANVDGSEEKRVLVDGPRDGIRVLPLLFGRDDAVLYMDYQPDAIGDVIPFRQYAGVFALDVTSGEIRLLPGEPGCFCGAGVGGGTFVRLEVAQDGQGFDAVIHQLDAGIHQTIPALNITDFTQAGDVLVSPDGARAVYALAQVRDFGSPSQFVRTVFVMVNLTDGTQEALTDPLTLFLRPTAWTEDNSAIIFTSPFEAGTWKVNIEDGRLSRIASATYVGTLSTVR